IAPYCGLFQSHTEENAMSVITDLTNAVISYPNDDCEIEIVEFSITTQNGGTILDVGDEFQYKVKLTNNGQLTIKNVELQALGTKWADVPLSGSTGKFDSTALLTATFDLDPHHSFTTGFFRGKCIADTGGVAKDIVKAQIYSWDASWEHILDDHSVAGDPGG